MTVASRGVVVGMVIAASLAASPVAAAKSGYFTEPPERRSELTLRGTHGFEITIERIDGSVELTASKQSVSASYSVRSKGVPMDEIKARFPGLGRVSLRFHPSGKAKHRPPECKGRGPVEQRGTFRGSIKFEGEAGFTRVVATHARGDIYRSFREVCRSEAPGTLSIYSLKAAGKSQGRIVSVTASKLQREAPFALYGATTMEMRRGMFILRFALLTAPASTFAIEGPDTEPSAATVTPPSPFSGTASFHGTAGAPGEWKGPLAIELPGAGTVPLTGPSFESELCLNKRCVGRLEPMLESVR